MTDCPRCGAKLEAGESACPSCGAEVEATASFSPVEGKQEIVESAAFTGVKGPALVVQKGHGAGERFLIDRGTLSIGRDPSSDIFLNDVTVSRDHAVIVMEGDEVIIRDSGSLNGTYVNDQRVESAVLQDGDIVQVGTFCMAFVGEKGAGKR